MGAHLTMEGIILMDFGEFINTPLINFGKPMYDRFTAINLILGAEIDVNKLIISTLKGDWFIVYPQKLRVKPMSQQHRDLVKCFGESIDITKFYEMRFWNYTGGTFLGCITFDAESLRNPIPKKAADQIKVMLDQYSEGNIMCSDCLKLVRIEETGGSFGAGTYCADCWEGKTGKHMGKEGWRAEAKKERVS